MQNGGSWNPSVQERVKTPNYWQLRYGLDETNASPNEGRLRFMLRSILPKNGNLEILLCLEHASSMLQCVRSGVIPMSDALQLVEQIRSDLRPLEAKISCHPYLKALERAACNVTYSRCSPGSNTTS